MPRIVLFRKKNRRNSLFMVYETDFSFSFSIFDVNCAFLAVRYFSVAAMPLAIV